MADFDDTDDTDDADDLPEDLHDELEAALGEDEQFAFDAGLEDDELDGELDGELDDGLDALASLDLDDLDLDAEASDDDGDEGEAGDDGDDGDDESDDDGVTESLDEAIEDEREGDPPVTADGESTALVEDADDLLDEVGTVPAGPDRELDVDDEVREGEFVCRSCFMAKRESALADEDQLLCRDCV